MKIYIPNHFIKFKTSKEVLELPTQLNNPFNNIPKDIAALASKELQEYITCKDGWNKELGVSSEIGQGKMFGVLVVKNQENELGYLAAFSGKLFDSNHHDGFVPTVFDTLEVNGFYKLGEEKLNELSRAIETLETDATLKNLKIELSTIENTSKIEIDNLKKQNSIAKKQRDFKRLEIDHLEDENQKQTILKRLINESSTQHFQLKDLTKTWKEKKETVQAKIEKFESEIQKLKTIRKEKSSILQHQLFEKYSFLNQNKESKNLLEIFNDFGIDIPPSAAGECAAPKLFQYAFENNLTPISLAEFWWGKSPASEVRKHGEFYGSCKGKCKPILSHMLNVTPHDSFVVIENLNDKAEIKTIYEDENLVVINKPHEFLSVPGKNSTDSIFDRMKEKYPDATGPMMVHRLDMSTSGLMIVAKNLYSYQNLQAQFAKKKVIKRYLAILDGILENDEGKIDLPLRVDIDNRPHQMVCYDHGKPAQTNWKVIERLDNKTKVYFYPLSGRTHQLRVHASHQLGLNTPILGDDLYGTKADRLYLQAQAIEFRHPITNEVMKFELEHEF